MKMILTKVDAKVTERETLTSGMSNAVKIHFVFSDEWNGLTKIAVFSAGKATKDVLLDDTNECFVPPEVCYTSGFAVKCGVYGILDGITIIPSIYADLGFIREGADPEGDTETKTPGLWEQAIGMINEAKESAETANEKAQQFFTETKTRLENVYSKDESIKMLDSKANTDHTHNNAKTIYHDVSLVGITTGGSGNANNSITDSRICESIYGVYHIDIKGDVSFSLQTNAYSCNVTIDGNLVTEEKKTRIKWAGTIERGIEVILNDGNVMFKDLKLAEHISGFMTGKQAQKLEDTYLKEETFSKTEITTAIADAVAKLVDSSPQTLDTLNEVAKALGNDPNFATTIMALIGEKANAKDVYTATQTDSAIAEAVKGKANIGDSYTKEENDSKTADAIKDKADKDDVSNAFKGQASGELVAMDDISPVAHNITVKVNGADKVYALGKNFVTTPFAEGNKNINGMVVTELSDGGVKISGRPTAASGYYINSRLKLKAGTYTYSGSDKLNIANCTLNMYVRDVDAVSTIAQYVLNASEVGKSVTFTLTEEKTIAVYFVVSAIGDGCVFEGYIYPQVEYGTKATEFYKSIKPIEYAVSDGMAKVKSIYPTTVVYSDIKGAVIEAEYNKDLNRVFGDIDKALDMILEVQEQYLPAEVEEVSEGGDVV